MFAEHLTQRVVEQVCGCMVGRCGLTGVLVDGCLKGCSHVGRELFGQVHADAVFAFGVVDFYGLVAGGKCSAVTCLTTHFSIERGH